MPSGDAQRVWFPEMVRALVAAWSSSITWEELARICGRLTEMRAHIRTSRGIQAPLIRCPRCGCVSRSDIRGITISSALFALREGGVLSDADFDRLDLAWKKHRAARGLDALGREPGTSPDSAPGGRSSCC
jgi:hypothetical protein